MFLEENGNHDSTSENQKSKRRRIALACQDCRKRKLKCDREYPICGRCRQTQHPEACTYDPGAAEEISSKQISSGMDTSQRDTAAGIRPRAKTNGDQQDK